jgi:hypothetical protein
MMYSFGNRIDTAVVDEPLYGFYLSKTSAKEYHPSAEEIMDSMDCDGDSVIEQLLAFNEKPIYFIKNMTHHLLDLNLNFFSEMEHIILTREPEAMIRSFSKVIAHPQPKDLGYEDHLKLIGLFRKRNIPFHVVDSQEILNNPEHRLKTLCNAVGIPFSKAMLKWPKGARKEDGIWAKHWYASVHESTHFERPIEKQRPESLGNLKELIESSRILYRQIISC